MKSDDLIQVAVDLADTTRRGREREAFFRRSISTAYYALFHALARLCAAELVGARKASTFAWSQAYRGLEHGQTKGALIELARQFGDADLKLVADAFALLQQHRHEADYDPRASYARGDVQPLIVLATLAIQGLEWLPAETKLTVAAKLVIRSRR